MVSLTDYKEVVHRDKEKGTSATVKVPDAVAEQRVTPLAINVLMALSSVLAPVLKLVPQSVLYGVFLYMGASSIAGNPLFDRMSLWLIWDTSKYPAFPFIRGIELKRLHLYTLVQFTCLVVLYALTRIEAVAVAFPFFLVIIAIVRLFLPRIFTARELEVLDGTSLEDDDVANGHTGKSEEMIDEKVHGNDVENTATTQVDC
jgi:solute carrier family 4 (anion exchanger) protein 1